MDLELIEEVKNQPILYDPDHELYKDVDRKREIWLDIGEKIISSKDETTTVSALKVRWKNLRDAYVKERKYELAQTCGVKVKYKKPWRLKKQLEFLAPFIQLRKDFPSSTVAAAASTQKKCKDRGKKSDKTTVTSNEISATVQDPNLRLKSEINLFNQTIPLSNNQRFIEIDSFFKDIANAVKGLRRKNQILLEKDITKLVMNYKLKELEEEQDQ